MAAFIKNRVTDRGSILTDNAQTFGVILLTGRPEVFFDRVDKGDTKWRRVAARPQGGEDEVDYFLVAQDAGGDQLHNRYPEAADNQVQGLEVVYFNERYTLLRVTADRPLRPEEVAQQEAAAEEDAATTAPEGVAPAP
jgi:hypothetical protein